VAVCGRKPSAGQFGDKIRRLAIPGRDECVDLVTRNRTPWRALLRQRRGFPRAGADLVDRNGAGLRPAKIGRHGGRPSNILRTRRGSAYRKPGGRCSVSAHFSRAQARLCRTDGGGASPRISRTTRRSSLQGHRRLRSASSPAPPPSTASLRLLHPSDFSSSYGRLVSQVAGQTEADAVAGVRGAVA
jgi:hypothetical protein